MGASIHTQKKSEAGTQVLVHDISASEHDLNFISIDMHQIVSLEMRRSHTTTKNNMDEDVYSVSFYGKDKSGHSVRVVFFSNEKVDIVKTHGGRTVEY